MRDKDGVKEYYPSGTLEWSVPYKWFDPAMTQDNFKGDRKGKKHGVAKCFYESGQLKIERTYVDGSVEGVEMVYYPDGSVCEMTTYAGNKKNGLFKSYFKNGQQEIEASYSDDKKHGLFTRWNEGGEFVFQKEFVNGV